MHPIRRGRTQDIAQASTFVSIAPDPGTLADDLVLLAIGTRASGIIPAVPDGWTVVGSNVDWTPTTTSPASFLAWGKPPDPNNPTAPIVVSSTNGATNWVARATTFDGATVYWPNPIAHRTRDRGFGNPILVQNHVSAPGDWGGQPNGRFDFQGGAAVYYRANTYGATSGTNWDQDAGATSVLAGDANGLRGRWGYSTDQNQPQDPFSMSFGNSVLNANAYATSESWVIRGVMSPIPEFQADQATDGYAVTFDSSDTYEPVAEYLWDFGDGSTSDVANPTHAYIGPGTYTVRLTVTNAAGTAYVEHQVVVSDIPPTAAWTYVNVPGTRQVAFTDASVNATAWSWDFGDGGTSTEPSPVHEYAADGAYTVALTASNTAGDDTAQETVTVYLGVALPPRPDGVVLDLQVEIGTTWESLYCELAGLSWAWGASEDAGYLTVGSPQQLQATLVDPTRRFDPGNASSPAYGLLRTGRQVRVLFGTRIVYQGRLVDVLHDLTFATLQVDDAIAQVGVVDVDTDGPLSLPDGQGTSDRIAALANLAGWPSALLSVETDPTALLGSELAERTVWEALVETAQATLGVLATSQAGELVYRTRATAWAPGEPTFLVGCDVDDATADVGTDSIVMASGADRIRNVISAQRKGTEDAPVVASDQDSIDAYGLRTATATELVVRNQGDLQTWVDLVLGNLKEPAYGGRAVSFVLRGPDLADKVASAQFGDLWRLFDDHHGAPIDLVGRLAGLAYQVGPATIGVTARIYEDPGLAPAIRQAILDTPAELATGTLDNVDASSGTAAVDKVTT